MATAAEKLEEKRCNQACLESELGRRQIGPPVHTYIKDAPNELGTGGQLAVTLAPTLYRLSNAFDEAGQALLELALPDRQHLPAVGGEGILVPPVALSVARDLGFPVSGVLPRLEVAGAALAAVPETPVQKHADLGRAEYDVWGAGEAADVLTIAAQTRGPKRPTELDLRPGLRRPVGAHRLGRRLGHLQGVPQPFQTVDLPFVSHLDASKG